MLLLRRLIVISVLHFALVVANNIPCEINGILAGQVVGNTITYSYTFNADGKPKASLSLGKRYNLNQLNEGPSIHGEPKAFNFVLDRRADFPKPGIDQVTPYIQWVQNLSKDANNNALYPGKLFYGIFTAHFQHGGEAPLNGKGQQRFVCASTPEAARVFSNAASDIIAGEAPQQAHIERNVPIVLAHFGNVPDQSTSTVDLTFECFMSHETGAKRRAVFRTKGLQKRKYYLGPDIEHRPKFFNVRVDWKQGLGVNTWLFRIDILWYGDPTGQGTYELFHSGSLTQFSAPRPFNAGPKIDLHANPVVTGARMSNNMQTLPVELRSLYSRMATIIAANRGPPGPSTFASLGLGPNTLEAASVLTDMKTASVLLDMKNSDSALKTSRRRRREFLAG